MHIFSMRAKNRTEVSHFVKAARSAGVSLSDLTMHTEPASPAVEAEFMANAALQHLRDLAADIAGSMFRGTLRQMPRDENPMTFGCSQAFRA